MLTIVPFICRKIGRACLDLLDKVVGGPEVESLPVGVLLVRVREFIQSWRVVLLLQPDDVFDGGHLIGGTCDGIILAVNVL